ncbi:uncharacterized protein LOC100900891 [Galendromus occidentalis]|uniref:Uncharacterized protein LOC100900891 n=1 Tax=Galendromus occidentalis TaxID=34638 RepID=A0AAJ6QX47_9ACAR|nr:uncharacterized protein LOC100900891 [Galendromus occidentalis]
MINQCNSEDSQLYGNRQLKKIYNLPQRRLNREVPRLIAQPQFPEQHPHYSFNSQGGPPYSNPVMDHLTLAFDQAIQNLGIFLDTLTAPPTAPHSVQMGIAGMNTVIIDYLNLLEACCVNHPMLKSKIQMITQKLVALQNTGSLPSNQGGTMAAFSFPQQARPAPNPCSMMVPGSPMMAPVPNVLPPHVPGCYGAIGMSPPHMNRSRQTQMPMDPNRGNSGFRTSMGHPTFLPSSPLEFYPTPNPSPPLNVHPSFLMSDCVTGFSSNKPNEANVASAGHQII